ncbi:16S rRNA (guanine(527)-N(7))-methyltransferase RsmG [Alkalibacter mobilis]|uniref:16S rRNA (guanine(527)-N(7))-methyltransferase RsmG n=1 Tax=Alkalibacter mobilis TaxID=2787712 RepID=UPI0018A0EF08|nr:16S rRNA (guanine(527)-N(7))-methyltransferase RsmG [Alkalibacter mobilis]MBF7096077.1 16S rRNA (guanine(527)-N(7))-methyltransferase RsmG [Alkalibacter mobilis]
MNEKEMLISELIQKDINVTDDQAEKLISYMNMVLEENKVMNLTAITDPVEFIYKHIIDSIMMYKDDHRELKVLDLGTGGGFPGIPLKIIHPEWKMTMLDSTEKKIRFIERASKTLELSGVEFVHGRAEDLGQEASNRENYDLVFSRAVASLNVLAEYCIPFVKKGGHFIASKGPKYEEEVETAKKAVAILGGKMVEIKTVEVLKDQIVRYIIDIEKVKETPKKYPRRQGIPAKKPL